MKKYAYILNILIFSVSWALAEEINPADYKKLKVQSIDILNNTEIFKLEDKQTVKGFKVFKYIIPFSMSSTEVVVEPENCSLRFVKEKRKKDSENLPEIKKLKDEVNKVSSKIKGIEASFDVVKNYENDKVDKFLKDINKIQKFYEDNSYKIKNLQKQMEKLDEKLGEKLRTTHLVKVGVFCPSRKTFTVLNQVSMM